MSWLCVCRWFLEEGSIALELFWDLRDSGIVCAGLEHLVCQEWTCLCALQDPGYWREDSSSLVLQSIRTVCVLLSANPRQVLLCDSAHSWHRWQPFPFAGR